MRYSFLLFLFGHLAVLRPVLAQSTIKSLLQYFDASPPVFKKFATSELKASFGSTILFEGGLISEDKFNRGDLILVKSYGYYALRNSADRQLRKRLGMTGANRINWRDSSWNEQRERDWTGITLSTAGDSIAHVLLREMEVLGAREFKPCLRASRINDVSVEETTYSLDNNYIIVFRKYFYPEGAKYDIRLARCPSD